MLGGKFQMIITRAIVIWRKRYTPVINERGICAQILLVHCLVKLALEKVRSGELTVPT